MIPVQMDEFVTFVTDGMESLKRIAFQVLKRIDGVMDLRRSIFATATSILVCAQNASSNSRPQLGLKIGRVVRQSELRDKFVSDVETHLVRNQ